MSGAENNESDMRDRKTPASWLDIPKDRRVELMNQGARSIGAETKRNVEEIATEGVREFMRDFSRIDDSRMRGAILEVQLGVTSNKEPTKPSSKLRSWFGPLLGMLKGP